MLHQRTVHSRLFRLLPIALMLLLIPLAMLLFSGSIGRHLDQEQLRMTEKSIRRAAVQCYALEGAYPTDLGYLEQNYGVAYDRARVFVQYQYVASNLAPDITVLPLP